MAGMISLLMTLAVMAPGAQASCSPACVKRVQAKAYAKTHGGCYSPRCTLRVRAKHDARLMARYKRNPMPRCTWHGESGAHLGEWAEARYRAKNPTSTAGGKFQMLDSSFHAVGGRNYPGTHDAAQAPPVVQERLARRLLKLQGLGAWVLC